MTRSEVLARYRPVRASIQAVLRTAVAACGRADTMRAAKQLGLWTDDGLLLFDDDKAIEMLSDVALFEPNQRGRRAFDRFLSGPAEQLGGPDLVLAQRMAGAVFSLFRYVGRHEVAGVWLKDVLDADRRLWMVDEGLEASATEGMIIGMRLFDASPFHAGFGIITQPDDETIEMCVQTRASSGRLPFRHSLAATLYADELNDALPPTPAEEQALQILLEGLAPSPGDQQPKRPRRPPARKGKPRDR